MCVCITVLGAGGEESARRIDGYGVDAAVVLDVAAVRMALERRLYRVLARDGVEYDELVALGAHDDLAIVEPLAREDLVQVGVGQVELALAQNDRQAAREVTRAEQRAHVAERAIRRRR